MPTETTIRANRMAASYFRLMDPRYDLFCRKFVHAIESKDPAILSAVEHEAFALVELHSLDSLADFDFSWKVSPDWHAPSGQERLEKAHFQLSREATVLLKVSITREALEAEIAARKQDRMDIPPAFSEALGAFDSSSPKPPGANTT